MSEASAVYWMWKRELIRFFRAKSRILGSLGMPFLFLAILGTGLNNAINIPGYSGSYLQFMAPGIIAMTLLFTSIFSGVIVIMDRQFGFLKETLVSPVNRSSIVIGKSIGGATAAVIQGILMLIIAVALGMPINWIMLLPALAVMMLISMSFVSLGLAMASTMEDMQGFQLIMNFLVMPLFFLSGAVFPLSSAPQIVQYIAYIDPLTYGVEALRFLLLGYTIIPIYISIVVLLLFFALTTGVAVHLFNRIEN